jgi:hypothetical protein
MEKKFFKTAKINCSHEPLFARSLDIRFAGVTHPGGDPNHNHFTAG